MPIDVLSGLAVRLLVRHSAISCGLLFRALLAEEPRQQHGNPPAVCGIVLAMGGEQIPLLPLNGGQDVGGCEECKYQMCCRHGRRRPKGKQPTHIERMADVSIRPWGPELQ